MSRDGDGGGGEVSGIEGGGLRREGGEGRRDEGGEEEV